MSKAFSTYLDAVRFLAAMLVVIAHLTFKQFTGGLFAYQGSLAAIAVTAFFVLSGYVIAYVASVNAALGGWPFKHLNNSTHFSTHYLVGALFALNRYAVRFCRIDALALPLLRRPITYRASFTFALYLAHLPLLYLWSFVIRTDGKSASKMAVLFVLVMASVWAFGLVSEHRKRQWRVVIRAMFVTVGIKVPPIQGLAVENS